MATAVAKSEPRKVRPWFRRGPLESIREEMQDLISRTFGEEGDFLVGGSHHSVAGFVGDR